jgi:hypothetical protein
MQIAAARVERKEYIYGVKKIGEAPNEKGPTRGRPFIDL